MGRGKLLWSHTGQTPRSKGQVSPAPQIEKKLKSLGKNSWDPQSSGYPGRHLILRDTTHGRSQDCPAEGPTALPPGRLPLVSTHQCESRQGPFPHMQGLETSPFSFSAPERCALDADRVKDQIRKWDPASGGAEPPWEGR